MSEEFKPRGIGSNWLRCFVCGDANGGRVGEDGIHYSGACQPDMSSFVSSRKAGLRVHAMFVELGFDGFLDYRSCEPNYVQFKLGACHKHRPCLEKLAELVAANDWHISPALIKRAVDEPHRQENCL